MSFAPARQMDEIRSPLSAYAKAAITALFGVALGLAATELTTSGDFPFGATQAGLWTAWPRTGALDIDPYAHAIVARRAEAPLGNGEGMMFLAQRDADQRALDGSCEYFVEGQTPAARYWTMAIFAPSGRPVDVGAGRTWVSSADVLRDATGQAQIVIAPSARAGNWIASPNGRAFVIALNLYDAAAPSSQAALHGVSMPAIRRGACL